MKMPGQQSDSKYFKYNDQIDLIYNSIISVELKSIGLSFLEEVTD